VVNPVFDKSADMKRGMSTGDIASVINSIDAGDNDDDGFIQVQSRRKRTKRITTKSQNRKDITGAINSSNSGADLQQSQSQLIDDTGSGFVKSDFQQLHAIVQDLQATVQSQQNTIQQLSNQLQFVLSFLGITEPNSTDSVDKIAAPAASAVSPVVADSAPAVSVTAVRTDRSQQSTNQAPTVLSAPLRRAVVSAVYTDFEEKDRRVKNVVFSGVSTTSISDKASVEKLCHAEFGFTPQIVKCRRLGQPRSGHVQPLLVMLQTVDEAEFLIKNAKLLRQSRDSAIRDSVYINPDQTKAEALAAYQRRCRRRELAAARNTTRSTSVTGNNNDAAPHPHPISVLSTRVPSVGQPAVPAVTSVPAQAPASSSSLCISTQSSTTNKNTEINAVNGQSTSVASNSNA